MVDQLNIFASEVTRMAREVGTEGKLDSQAVVTGAAGTWKELIENTNRMSANLTEQIRNIAAVTIAVAQGDLSKQIEAQTAGEFKQLTNNVLIYFDVETKKAILIDILPH